MHMMQQPPAVAVGNFRALVQCQCYVADSLKKMFEGGQTKAARQRDGRPNGWNAQAARRRRTRQRPSVPTATSASVEGPGTAAPSTALPTEPN
jgi:hypothetical protein